MPEGNENNDTGDKAFTPEQVKEMFNNGQWREFAPEDIAASPQMAKFNEKPFWEIPKAYMNLEKHMGNTVPRPSESYTKKEWDEWNSKYNPGYPKDPTGYGLQRPEFLDAEFPYSEEEQQAFEKFAHENGMSASQAKRIWEGMLKRNHDIWMENQTNYKQFVEKDEETLKNEWGAAYDDNKKYAQHALKEFGSDELIEQFKNSRLSSNVWKFLANVGKQMSEGKLEEHSKSAASLAPKEAMSKANELMEKAHKAHREGDRIGARKFTEEATKYFELAEVRKD